MPSFAFVMPSMQPPLPAPLPCHLMCTSMDMLCVPINPSISVSGSHHLVKKKALYCALCLPEFMHCALRGSLFSMYTAQQHPSPSCVYRAHSSLPPFISLSWFGLSPPELAPFLNPQSRPPHWKLVRLGTFLVLLL